MLRHCLYAGVILVGFVLPCGGARGSTGYDQPVVQPVRPPPMPATPGGDASENRKFYTFTATLREQYDDNIYTAKTGRVSSLETDVSPSVLVDFPTGDSDFSARYTFGLNFYDTHQQEGAYDISHELVAQYRHDFSNRFSMNAAEQFLYSTEPDLQGNTGTLYRNGGYYTNVVNAGFNGQWTPLFGTTTTYANTIVRYEDGTDALGQDNMENTGTQNFGFAILPKINLVFGGIVDEINYDNVDRGYTSYTGNVGLDWQALPSLSLGGRVGATDTEADQSGSSFSPYAAVTLNWQLGKRSALNFSYVHDVVPTDVVTAEGQVADRFITTFRYDITPDITAHLAGNYTHGQYTQELMTGNGGPDFSEDDIAIDMGLAYHLNSHFDFEAGYIFSEVSSGASARDYTRDQIYLGVRGTY